MRVLIASASASYVDASGRVVLYTCKKMLTMSMAYTIPCLLRSCPWQLASEMHPSLQVSKSKRFGTPTGAGCLILHKYYSVLQRCTIITINKASQQTSKVGYS